MAVPCIDQSNEFDVTNTVYNSTNHYKYIPPAGKILKLRSFSIGVNSSFTNNNGHLQIGIKGVPVTNQGNAIAEVKLIRTLTYTWADNDDVYITENDNFEVKFRVASGTGAKAQVAINGTLLDRVEYEKIMARRS